MGGTTHLSRLLAAGYRSGVSVSDGFSFQPASPIATVRATATAPHQLLATAAPHHCNSVVPSQLLAAAPRATALLPSHRNFSHSLRNYTSSRNCNCERHCRSSRCVPLQLVSSTPCTRDQPDAFDAPCLFVPHALYPPCLVPPHALHTHFAHESHVLHHALRMRCASHATSPMRFSRDDDFDALYTR